MHNDKKRDAREPPRSRSRKTLNSKWMARLRMAVLQNRLSWHKYDEKELETRTPPHPQQKDMERNLTLTKNTYLQRHMKTHISTGLHRASVTGGNKGQEFLAQHNVIPAPEKTPSIQETSSRREGLSSTCEYRKTNFQWRIYTRRIYTRRGNSGARVHEV